jgi:NAD+ diphosphatase
MKFVPGITPSSRESEPAWWFAFRENKLLVDPGGDTLPLLRDLSRVNMNPIRKRYLGALGGSPCYAVQLPHDAVAPEGLEFRGLRSLFGVFEDVFFQVAGLALQIVNWERSHQFCSRCGHPMLNKQDQRAKFCRQCGFVNHPRINPCVIVAVTNSHRILLARPNRNRRNFYSVIAGYVEAGETLEQCVRREVKEEVDIEVKHIRYFGSQSWPFSSSIMAAFTAEYAGGHIRVDGSEIADAGWYAAHNLPPTPGWGSIAGRLIDWFVKNNT